MFRVLISLQNPLYKTHSSDVGDWRAKGHDGVRVEDTMRSHQMEWCVREECVEIEKWRYTDEDIWRELSENPYEQHYAPKTKYDCLRRPPDVDKFWRDHGYER